MASIFDLLTSSLDPNSLSQISRQIGADQGATAAAVSAAIPVLMSALARNSATESGASSLANALERDHDGSALDDLGSLLGGGHDAGGAILKHMLGSRQGSVESALSQRTGLDSAGVGQLLQMLAPVVMAAVGRNFRQQGLDSFGLASMLGQEHTRINQSSDTASMLNQLLDSNNDGSIVDDIGRLAGGLFGNRS